MPNLVLVSPFEQFYILLKAPASLKQYYQKDNGACLTKNIMPTTVHVYQVFTLHRIAASPKEGPKANLTRNPFQHLIDKVPVDKLT